MGELVIMSLVDGPSGGMGFFTALIGGNQRETSVTLCISLYFVTLLVNTTALSGKPRFTFIFI